MNCIEQLHSRFIAFVAQSYTLDSATASTVTFDLNNQEARQAFGDISSNAALILAKIVKKRPLDIATTIANAWQDDLVDHIEIAGPGFLNIFLTEKAFINLAQELFTTKDRFFVLEENAPKQHYCVEFVSANPTGPLHLGHGRGGIIGDVLANVLSFLGHAVTKEFYLNDAGAQITKLGISFKIRCLQQRGDAVLLPEDSYQGEYLIDLAKEAVNQYGKSLFEKPDSFFQDYAKDKMQSQLAATLALYGIEFDVWFSEKSLHTSGAIDKAIALLKQNGYTYEQEGALWFSSTQFGDDKDRVLRKASGELTYVAADIAYMINKVERKHTHLIMVLGHDHHSYEQRLQGLRQALGLTQKLDIILYQLVKIKAEGQQVRMSKRKGTMVTLKEVIEAVGTDVTRFFYLHRKADAQLEFDLDLALKKTDENPVYYAQYAYVRTKSILAKAHELDQLTDINENDFQNLNTDDRLLLKKIIELKTILKSIEISYSTHTLTYYLLELATAFHRYYSHHKVIDPSAPVQSRCRLGLIILLKDTFETVLNLLGISLPEKM